MPVIVKTPVTMLARNEIPIRFIPFRFFDTFYL